MNTRPSQPGSESPRRKRIAVVCHDLGVAGSLFRFERFGRVARRLAHELSFVRLTATSEPGRRVDFPVLTMEEAIDQMWDVTIVPGATFPEETMVRLDRFRDPSFGWRMQHVLNDQTRKAAFLRVNALFQPHVVVFNNRHWPPGSFTSFQANSFHVCEGAVDSELFAPAPVARSGEPGRPFRIGGLAHKEPMALIEAVRSLDFDVELRLYGPPRNLPVSAADLIEEGRLHLLKSLEESELPAFYRELDCVVHTRTFAGWSNLAAEAMATGVPVICSPHGTLAFAEHEQTALVVQDPSAPAIAAAIERLRGDPALARRLADHARQRIVSFSWDRYVAELLKLMEPDDRVHYTWAPELGLFGKWPIEQRLRGLEPVIDQCAGKSVLDLGSAEGVIARRLLERGVACVHGFDRDAARVSKAVELCRGFPAASFWPADIGVWSTFQEQHAAHLRPAYDLVLYLGIHHHLPRDTRAASLAGAARLASAQLVVRAPEGVFRDGDIVRALRAQGFDVAHEFTADDDSDAGALRVFERRRSGG